jgi:hypothetical protein
MPLSAPIPGRDWPDFTTERPHTAALLPQPILWSSEKLAQASLAEHASSRRSIGAVSWCGTETGVDRDWAKSGGVGDGDSVARWPGSRGQGIGGGPFLLPHEGLCSPEIDWRPDTYVRQPLHRGASDGTLIPGAIAWLLQRQDRGYISHAANTTICVGYGLTLINRYV